MPATEPAIKTVCPLKPLLPHEVSRSLTRISMIAINNQGNIAIRLIQKFIEILIVNAYRSLDVVSCMRVRIPDIHKLHWFFRHQGLCLFYRNMFKVSCHVVLLKSLIGIEANGN